MLDSTHSLTHENLLLGEGVLLRNVGVDALLAAENPAALLAEAMENAACLIGATKEGCCFRCIPDTIDTTRGQRTPAAGELLTGRWQVSLTGTLLEMTPANAAMLLNAASPSASVPVQLVPQPAPVPASSPDVCWVGSTGSGMLAIGLRSPLSTGGLTLRPQRSGTGEMPFTLRAQKADPADTALPCCLLWLKEGSA